jgi:hypothetical protein
MIVSGLLSDFLMIGIITTWIGATLGGSTRPLSSP